MYKGTDVFDLFHGGLKCNLEILGSHAGLSPKKGFQFSECNSS